MMTMTKMTVTTMTMIAHVGKVSISGGGVVGTGVEDVVVGNGSDIERRMVLQHSFV